MSKRDLLDRIKDASVALDQNRLFGDVELESSLEKACVDYLKFRGYTVHIPKTFSREVKSTLELVEYFYELLNNNRSGNYTSSYNRIKDMSIAKRFVESRVTATGAHKTVALCECGEIIKTVFDNEKEFKFTTDIGFYMFGQGNMKWITDKAIAIMNGKLTEESEKRAEKMREEMIAAQDTSDLGMDLDTLLEELEEDNNGKS